MATPSDMTPVWRALREFDRFLDHHPRIEDELRLRPTLLQDEGFHRKNPELREFLATNPNVVPGLRTYSRYFLHRALLRQASAPLRYAEIAQLKEVFDHQPAVEQLLLQRPEAIRDPAFLAEHVALRDFLLHHPALGLAFLPGEACPPRSG